MTTKSLLEVLPKNIVESEELSLAAKKMLGALIDYFTHSQAKETQRLFMTNEKVCETANFGKSTLFKATRELEMYDLIEKKSGKARTQGQKSEASEYILHINNFIKPLRKKTFENLMSMFPKSWLQNSGNPLQDCSTVQSRVEKLSEVHGREEKGREEKSREEKSSEEMNTEKSREGMSREGIERKDECKVKKRVEQTVETDKKEELLQFFIETVNLDVERLYDAFFRHFNYCIESNTELGQKLIDYVFDKLAHTNYELYRKVCENVETVFKLEKPKYLINTTNTSTSSKVDEESSNISEIVQDEMPF